MSSTTGVQNLLVNVFRPAYFYDTTATLYTVKLDMSNVNTFYGNNAVVLWANVGDAGSNVYVGVNAGNDPTVTLKNCSNNTAVGYGAGSNIFNVQNSTYIGFAAGAGAAATSNTIAIGASAYGNGNSNIYIGNGTGANGSTGSNNIFVGHAIAPGNVSYQMRLGYSSNITLAGDLSQNWVGVGRTARSDTNVKFDVSGDTRIQGNLGVNITPGTRTLDVNGNFRAQDASGNVVDFSNGQVGINRTPNRTLDVNGSFRASNVNAIVDFSDNVLQSTGGVVSLRGTITSAGIGSTTNIAVMKKGLILANAQDTASSTTNYECKIVYCLDATNGNNTAGVSGSQSGDVYVLFQSGGSNIQISNATAVRDINWSITYFPLT